MQQSKQVRRISDDDAAAASHTAQAVNGDLPLSSATASTDRDPTARAEPAPTFQLGSATSSMPAKPPSQLTKPKAPSVLVKPKAPALVVRAKRKADDADGSSLLPDKKQHQNDGSDAGPDASGLAGLAAYGSDSGSGSPSDS